jgi:hypothetical protein
MKTYKIAAASETRYRVSHEGAEYTVELSTGHGPACSCPDSVYRRRVCKHVGLVASYLDATLGAEQTSTRGGQCSPAPLR